MDAKIFQIIFFLFIITSTAYSQNMQFNNPPFSSSKQLDEKAIPWSANGKFLVTKILISPNIYSWEGDSVKSTFQDGNVTDLGRYLMSKFELDTLANMYVQKEKLFIVYDPFLANKRFLDSCIGTPMQPVFKPSRLQKMAFTYEIPLIIKGDKELSKGLFIMPGTVFIIDRNLQEMSKNKELLSYHIKIEADMTHYVDRETGKKLILLFGR